MTAAEVLLTGAVAIGVVLLLAFLAFNTVAMGLAIMALLGRYKPEMTNEFGYETERRHPSDATMGAPYGWSGNSPVATATIFWYYLLKLVAIVTVFVAVVGAVGVVAKLVHPHITLVELGALAIVLGTVIGLGAGYYVNGGDE